MWIELESPRAGQGFEIHVVACDNQRLHVNLQRRFRREEHVHAGIDGKLLLLQPPKDVTLAVCGGGRRIVRR
ncbi:hypothetical protein D3C83_96140 [compost metagenome]